MFFFFNDTATTEIYTLSLRDALPIYRHDGDDGPLELGVRPAVGLESAGRGDLQHQHGEDRKSTRLNSSHANISYAVFCLKKKNDMLLLPAVLRRLPSRSLVYPPPFHP